MLPATVADPIKIIHWEYYKTPESITTTETYMSYRPVFKPNTSVVFGLLFRYVVKFYKGDFISLNFLAEQAFINEKIKEFTFPHAKQMLVAAHKNCSECFDTEYKKVSLGGEITHTVKDFEVLQLLNYLKEL